MENISDFHSAIIFWIQREIQILTHLKQVKKTSYMCQNAIVKSNKSGQVPS